MPTEKCEGCGFDSEAWSDAASIEAIGLVGTRWAAASPIFSLTNSSVALFQTMWSIAEYTDHVREVLFGMRFVLDSAINEPGIDLGAVPEPEFSALPGLINIQTSLDGISREAGAPRATSARTLTGVVGCNCQDWKRRSRRSLDLSPRHRRR